MVGRPPDWLYRFAFGHDAVEDNVLDLSHRHLFSLNLIEFLLLQCGKEAFHWVVIIAAPHAAHTLHGAISGEAFPTIRTVNWLCRSLCRIMPFASCTWQAHSNARMHSSFFMLSSMLGFHLGSLMLPPNCPIHYNSFPFFSCSNKNQLARSKYCCLLANMVDNNAVK